MVSFFTDVSAELITAFLPVYLLYGLGVGYLQLGVLDGLYTGATAVLRLVGGYAADRFSRPKAVALFGYGLSALTKLGFPAVGGSVAGIGAMIAVDRAGKGIRTAPRDAMITAGSARDTLGRSFGVHRALDTAGALLGPMLAFVLLAGVGSAYDAVFVTSFCLAVIGVLILVFFVRPDRTAAGGSTAVSVRPVVTMKAALALFGRGDLRRVLGCVVLLGLATAGDAFVYIALSQRGGLGATSLSLMPLGTALAFLLTATAVGRLADRFGRWRTFCVGQLLLVAGYTLLAAPITGWGLLVVLALHGVYYAATDGVLMAHAGALLPAELRASGLAVLQSGQALARMVAAMAFGAVAQQAGLGPTFGIFACLLSLGAVVGLRCTGRNR